MYLRYSNVRTMHSLYKNCLVSRGVSKNIIGYNSFRIILAAVSRPGSYNQGLSYFYVDLLNCISTLMDCIGRMSKLTSNAKQFYTASGNDPDISDYYKTTVQKSLSSLRQQVELISSFLRHTYYATLKPTSDDLYTHV